VDQELADAFKQLIAEQKEAGATQRDYYFTFGYDHEDNGIELRNKYMVFFGTYDEARYMMYEMFDNKWSHQYSTKEDAGVDRFNLTEYKRA
jgi:hypothetical protein